MWRQAGKARRAVRDGEGCTRPYSLDHLRKLHGFGTHSLQLPSCNPQPCGDLEHASYARPWAHAPCHTIMLFWTVLARICNLANCPVKNGERRSLLTTSGTKQPGTCPCVRRGPCKIGVPETPFLPCSGEKNSLLSSSFQESQRILCCHRLRSSPLARLG